jgi:photosystem II stability/assembly factor-like uncharacterized protein
MTRLSSLIILLFAFSYVDGQAQSLESFAYRNVGPSRGGRVTTVAGTVREPGTFYMGATGGGVWKTVDYGITWKNVSDGYFETPSIGAISVAQNDPNIVYVGTGSDGLRSNVIVGKGMYKSIDGGSTWQHIGLKNVGQIGAVEINPNNHNIVYVAAIGQPFRDNPERGVYKTTDGGKTWKKMLFISDQVGAVDIELLPGNPEIVFAAVWKGQRKPWTIISGGNAGEGGIYKSIDGGGSWQKLTMGLPPGLIGKIDLAVTPADSKMLYAVIEAPDKEGGLYISEDQGGSFKQVSGDIRLVNRPFYYTNIDVDPTNPDIIHSQANPYIKSTDRGKTWVRIDPPHGDNHDIWINPENPDLLIQANDGGANVSQNGGKTWSSQFNQPTAELYQVEVDDQYPYWLYAGQQDNYTTIAVPSLAPYGIQAAGIGWIINTGGCETGPAVPKPGNHNIVYANCKGRFGVYDKRTGIEKGYYVGGANMYGHNPKDLRYRFQRVSPIHVSPHNPDVVYHTSQYVHRTTDEGKTWETISPDLTAFEAGKQVISGSPITRDITGEEFYSTIYAIRESTVKQGVIWVGANDGPVHVTTDNGQSWANVTPAKLPPGGRVDAVEPSPHNPAKAYVAVLRHQLGDDKPYIYKTENYGRKWELLTTGSNGIPADFPTRVIREDPVREGLLFAGTEFGMFVSFDDGKNWRSFQQNLPVTPITDIKIHRGDLVVSTMGRSFWILDNVATLRQPAIDRLGDEVILFKPENTIRYRYPKVRQGGFFPSYPVPSVIIDYYLPTDVKGDVQLQILDANGKVVNAFKSGNPVEDKEEQVEDMGISSFSFIVAKSLAAEGGLQRFDWDMKYAGAWAKSENLSFKDGPMAAPGTYTVRLIAGDKSYDQEFELLMDPRVIEGGTTASDVNRQLELELKVVALLADARRLENSLSDEQAKLNENKKEAALTPEDQARLTKISAALDLLKTKTGAYPTPMLTSQIGYLYNMIKNADQLPGKDAYDRFGELSRKLAEVTKRQLPDK